MCLRFCVTDAVRIGDVMEDGDMIPMTTAVRSWGGGSGCSVWLKFVSQGAGPVVPPINERTIVFSQNGGGMVYIWIVYTRREALGVMRVTGSLLHLVLACHLAVLCDCSSGVHLNVLRL